ncbi:MAG: amidohydrolase family protein [Chitinophagaceae bacterium]|nr:amidohydrolase family protein [Chitinophagaceae bacterium]
MASHHQPHEYDSKVLEFEYAKPGMIALESAFGLMVSSIPQLSPEQVANLLAIAPRKLLGLPKATIEVGAEASLTLFNTNAEVTCTPDFFRSKSKNTPLLGKKLKGKVLGIVNKGQLVSYED